MKLLATAIVTLTFSASAADPEFKIFPAPSIGQFMVFGKISDGFEQQMRSAIDQNPKIRLVVIESPGGLSLEAKRTAKLLNEHHISIRAGGRCASACALLWAATDSRQLSPTSRIGLHSGRAKKVAPALLEGAASRARTNISNDMLRRAGFSERLIARGNSVPVSEVLWLTPSDLAEDGVKFTLVSTKPPNNSFKPTPLRGVGKAR